MGHLQFGRDRRLTESSQFTRVLAQAKRSSDRYFTVLSLANGLTFARLGLTVSRKSARRAVDRNRIKRVTRELFRQSQFPQNDIVVMARAAAATAARRELRDSLQRHFHRLGQSALAGR